MVQKRFDGQGELKSVKISEEIVTYEIYETDKFRIKVRKGAIGDFNEKLNTSNKEGNLKYTVEERDSMATEYIQSKMRKLPKVKAGRDEFYDSFLAFEEEINLG